MKTSKVLDFVDDNGDEVLSLGSVVKVSEETIRTILSRESLVAAEFVKFQVTASQLLPLTKIPSIRSALNLCQCNRFYWKLRNSLHSALSAAVETGQ